LGLARIHLPAVGSVPRSPKVVAEAANLRNSGVSADALEGDPMSRSSPPPGLDRRALLTGLGAAGAAAWLAPGATSATAGAEATAAATGPTAEGGAASFPLAEATIDDLGRRMASGELTARRIAELYLERIAAVDRPQAERRTTNAVVEVNPDALALADALDAERRAAGPRGPLHGIPVLLKDNLDTADRMQSTAGSLALVGVPRREDAFAAARLRAAGALVMGKANLSEWANFRSTRSVSGWSGRGGQTRNPYALDRSPCGSSSGSAAAVAADLAVVAVGTETDGSIVCPASICGIVGLKPTVGLVSRRGITPISRSQDTAGPMARTVRDAAHLLTALAGVDPGDAATAAAAGKIAADYTTFLGVDLRGVRLGVARNHFGFDPKVDALMEQALEVLRGLGAELVDPANLPHAGEYDEAEYEVLLYEFKADLEAYLAGLGPECPVRTLADLIAWNEKHASEELALFGQEIFALAAAKGPLTETAYLEALAKCRRLSREEGIDAILDGQRLDALVAPSNAPAWLIDPVRGDHYGGGSSSPAAVAGYPSITVPCGFAWELPVGITFYGRAWSEGVLLGIAHAFEQATRARRAPRFLASVTP
jgi:amidase